MIDIENKTDSFIFMVNSLDEDHFLDPSFKNGYNLKEKQLEKADGILKLNYNIKNNIIYF